MKSLTEKFQPFWDNLYDNRVRHKVGYKVYSIVEEKINHHIFWQVDNQCWLSIYNHEKLN